MRFEERAEVLRRTCDPEFAQHWMREELAIVNHQVDARDVHVHDASGANVEMPDLAVAHLPLPQAGRRRVRWYE